MALHTTLRDTFRFRKCMPTELDAVMSLQDMVYRAIKNKAIFVPSERCENDAYLKTGGFIVGCYDGARLIAYASVALHGEGEHNLGWDLQWPREKVLSCAVLDTVVVHPSYRGNQLQQRLIRSIIEYLHKDIEIRYILTTVSPENEYSLHNVQAMGFEIKLKKLKYGGRERFILCLTL